MSDTAKYTCIGKGGLYEVVGVSTGAGPLRKDRLTVYRNVDTGELHHRSPEDFDLRMLNLSTGAVDGPTHPDLPLKRGTLVCPGCKQAMEFEQAFGMRVVREGFLNARCRPCKTEYKVIPNENRND